MYTIEMYMYVYVCTCMYNGRGGLLYGTVYDGCSKLVFTVSCGLTADNFL